MRLYTGCEVPFLSMHILSEDLQEFLLQIGPCTATRNGNVVLPLTTDTLIGNLVACGV